MARLRPLPRRPAPPPLPTNDVGVAVAGTIGWTLALIVLLIIDVPAGSRWWLGVCGTGIAIGLFAIWYVPRLQRSRAAAAERRAQTRAQAQAETLIHFDGPGDTAAAGQDDNGGADNASEALASGHTARDRDRDGRGRDRDDNEDGDGRDS